MPLPRTLLFLCALASLVLVAKGAESTPAAEAGRRIYEQGIGSGGRHVSAAAGSDGALLPDSFTACLNCHGPDGRGRTEGGLSVPPITWDQLDKPYGATRPDGRLRAAYDEATFHTALTRGLDPSGQPLGTAMPRYSLTPQESADLAAYLRQIGRRAVPGVGDDTILLGWHAPAGRSATVAGKVLEAWAAEVNAAGGVFRRQVKPVALAGGAPTVFAALAAGESESDANAALALARSGVPVLIAGRAPGSTHENEHGLFALFPAEAHPPTAGEMPPQAVEEYLAFAQRHGLPAQERELQLALLSSAHLFLEAVKNTGRDLDREKFLSALETLSEVDTGFAPPATFTRRRHIAVSGGYARPATLRDVE